ncbi:unnamed protein product [Pleuronectes platessa]|uniref:Uncharacterized protein n=1 Tax=Pleuronectes platessa TaxID=8262 RepID=A0A9N7ZBZ2_PLEPL|nr:unnamed protein product [Pleuronectes platessa]
MLRTGRAAALTVNLSGPGECSFRNDQGSLCSPFELESNSRRPLIPSHGYTHSELVLNGTLDPTLTQHGPPDVGSRHSGAFDCSTKRCQSYSMVLAALFRPRCLARACRVLSSGALFVCHDGGCRGQSQCAWEDAGAPRAWPLRLFGGSAESWRAVTPPALGVVTAGGA